MIAELCLTESLKSHILFSVHQRILIKTLGKFIIDHGISTFKIERLLEIHITDTAIEFTGDTHRGRFTLHIERQSEHPERIEILKRFTNNGQLAGILGSLLPTLRDQHRVGKVIRTKLPDLIILIGTQKAR